MNSTFSGHLPTQAESELSPLIDFLVDKKVKKYLEIGVRHGDTFFRVMEKLPKGSLGMAVDLPNGAWGIPGSDNSLSDVAHSLREKGYEVILRFGDSQTVDMRDIVAEHGPFDAVLIDGDHYLEGVLSDYFNYKDLAKYIIFHDISNDMKKNKRGEFIEVPILWELLKRQPGHEFKEFIDPASNMGIGVIWKSLG